MNKPESYIIEGWSTIVGRAKHHLSSSCPLIEDEVLVKMDKYIKTLESTMSYDNTKQTVLGDLWYDNNKPDEDDEVIYNLCEDIRCLKERVAELEAGSEAVVFAKPGIVDADGFGQVCSTKFHKYNIPLYTTPQPVKVPETEECQHYSTSTGYDHNTCNDCGMIGTDGGWGIASRKWFKSVAEAKFYEAYGRLPD